eukprot:TRINITY_DN28808_c0_g1_i1.p1 TRINITY_DN28808_c0_g1~~TRINITY_DN28808_c0_g1_i1.p1  ORF type:complete len:550 (+),score=152.53 TRINITY_DN28808_c0_g1_i1:57-1706(+)
MPRTPLTPAASVGGGRGRENLVSRHKGGRVLVGARRRLRQQPAPSSWSRVAQDGAAPVRERRLLAASPSPLRLTRLPVPGGIPGDPETWSVGSAPSGRRRASSSPVCNPITGLGVEGRRDVRGRARSSSAHRRHSSSDAVAGTVFSACAATPRVSSAPCSPRGQQARAHLLGTGCAVDAASDCGSTHEILPAHGRGVSDRGRRKARSWYDAGSGVVSTARPGGWAAVQQEAASAVGNGLLPDGGRPACRSGSRGRRKASHWYDPDTRVFHTRYPASQVAWLQQGSHATFEDEERRRDGPNRPPIPFNELRQRPVGGKVRGHTTYDCSTREHTVHYPASQVPWGRCTGTRTTALWEHDPPRPAAPPTARSVSSLPVAGVKTGSAAAERACNYGYWDSPARRPARGGTCDARRGSLSGGGCVTASPARDVRFTSPSRGATRSALIGASCASGATAVEELPERAVTGGRRRRSSSAAHSRNPIFGESRGRPERIVGDNARRCSPSPSIHERNCITGTGVVEARDFPPPPRSPDAARRQPRAVGSTSLTTARF